MKFKVSHLMIGFLAFVVVNVATAAWPETPEFQIEILNHTFNPSELKIPADTKVKLKVINRDPTPEEFESYDFNREKIVGANSSIVVFVGPLRPGRYNFFGEFNPKTAQGYLVVE